MVSFHHDSRSQAQEELLLASGAVE